jgi:hypothetical protein
MFRGRAQPRVRDHGDQRSDESSHSYAIVLLLRPQLIMNSVGSIQLQRFGDPAARTIWYEVGETCVAVWAKQRREPLGYEASGDADRARILRFLRGKSERQRKSEYQSTSGKLIWHSFDRPRCEM